MGLTQALLKLKPLCWGSDCVRFFVPAFKIDVSASHSSLILPNVTTAGFQSQTFWGLVLVQEEKEMATHSSTLAWKIPWTEEPGRLQSMGSRRVGHD